MKNIKKFLSVLMTLVLITGLIGPVGVLSQEIEPEPPPFPMPYRRLFGFAEGEMPTEIPGRLVLTERTFFTQEQLREMIPPLEVRTRFQGMSDRALVFDLPDGYLNSHYPPSWVSRPHPDRRMTDQELSEWIEEYKLLGGLNVFELEVIYLINGIRAEHGLTQLTICPYLSMAARLGSQLRLRNHWDPFYGRDGSPSYGRGRPNDRARLFNPPIDDLSRVTVEESTAAGAIPMHPVTGWMESPLHRTMVLRSHLRYIGVGQHNFGQVVMKATRL